MITNFFDKAFYINRKDRIDRRDKFEEQLVKKNLNGLIQRFDAVHADDMGESEKASKAELACGYSHKNIIQLAKDQNLNSVLILEDDAYFLDNFEEVYNKSIGEINDLEWDLFYLSCRLFDNPIQLVKPNTIKINGCYCTHAYGVHSRAYDKYLQYNPENDGPVDVFLLNNQFTRFGSYPLCVSVYASNSDIIRGFTSYDNLIRESYDKGISQSS